jgi:hypothetical protein
VNTPAAIAAAARNAVLAPEYIVVKEKLPVSFYLSFNSFDRAAGHASYQLGLSLNGERYGCF